MNYHKDFFEIVKFLKGKISSEELEEKLGFEGITAVYNEDKPGESFLAIEYNSYQNLLDKFEINDYIMSSPDSQFVYNSVYDGFYDGYPEYCFFNKENNEKYSQIYFLLNERLLEMIDACRVDNREFLNDLYDSFGEIDDLLTLVSNCKIDSIEKSYDTMFKDDITRFEKKSGWTVTNDEMYIDISNLITTYFKGKNSNKSIHNIIQNELEYDFLYDFRSDVYYDTLNELQHEEFDTKYYNDKASGILDKLIESIETTHGINFNQKLREKLELSKYYKEKYQKFPSNPEYEFLIKEIDIINNLIIVDLIDTSTPQNEKIGTRQISTNLFTNLLNQKLLFNIREIL